jgi:hypothetical protein
VNVFLLISALVIAAIFVVDYATGILMRWLERK